MIVLKFILSMSISLVGIGLSDWSDYTPHGNEINNFMGTDILYLKDGTSLEDLSSWYFYKKHIIGTLKNYNPEKKEYDKDRYFVANEKTFEIEVFDSEVKWNTFIKDKNLNPKLWTRWYKTQWSFLDGILLLFIFGFFITIPLAVLFLRSLYIAITKEKFNTSKMHTKICITCFMFCFLTISINYLPHSI
ncbi:hypothetical protein [uncultured Algibacter sp.]|uniref:hypothetical protein n=1 Tax=uncultured Algibacter sp. TaxID=298659 RepID=UPI00321730B0